MQGARPKVSEEERVRRVDAPTERALACWASIEEFLEGISPRLRGIAGLYRVPPDDAEDLVQEALLTLVVKSSTVRNPEAWIVATFQRRCLVYWRRVRRREQRELRSPMELDDPGRWEEGLGDGRAPGEPWMRCEVERAVRTLSETMQEVVRLRYEEGCTHREVAERMGYSPGSMGQIHSRALRRLREHFQKG